VDDEADLLLVLRRGDEGGGFGSASTSDDDGQVLTAALDPLDILQVDPHYSGNPV
jgi:hypothetical protein